MKIAILAPVWERIPPPKYGGIEEVVAILSRGLAQRSHEVVLYASSDSHVEGVTTRAVYPENQKKCIGNTAVDQHHVRESLSMILEEGGFDLISNHDGYTPITISRFAKNLPPVITTLHGKVNEDNWPFFSESNHDCSFITISENQRGLYPPLNHLGTVYNALDFSRFPTSLLNERKEDYFIHLSRCSPEKGTHKAIEIAKRARVKLLLCCKVDSCDKTYYETRVKPNVDGDQIIWKDEITAEEKVLLIAKARGFIFPLQWPEPFGLVALEAMACGTCFITLPFGAMPELGVNGESYFLCGPAEMNNMRTEDAIKQHGQTAEDEMVEIVKKINVGELTLDPMVCRKHAERFNENRMLDSYESLYLAVCKQNSKNKIYS